MLFRTLISILFMCSRVICMYFRYVAERCLDVVSLFVHVCGFVFVCMCLVPILYLCSRVCYMCCKNVSGQCFNAISVFICLWGMYLVRSRFDPTLMFKFLFFHVVLNTLYFSCLNIIHFHKFIHGTLYTQIHVRYRISYVYLHNIMFMIHIHG